MKNIIKFLTESLNESKSDLTMYVPNTSVMMIYIMEMSGQISDGKYENSRPFGHWKWTGDINNIEVSTDKIGIESSNDFNIRSMTRNKYNLDDWVKYIKDGRKGKDTIWASRVIGYAKFGIIYPNITYNEIIKPSSYIRGFLEDIQLEIENGETDPKKIFEKITDFSGYKNYKEKYYQYAKKYIDEDFIKKYLDVKYDLPELKEDLKSLKEAVNTVL